MMADEAVLTTDADVAGARAPGCLLASTLLWLVGIVAVQTDASIYFAVHQNYPIKNTRVPFRVMKSQGPNYAWLHLFNPSLPIMKSGAIYNQACLS